jgi:hypothetical protein
MAPLVDVAGPCPRLGDVEAPPRSRSSLSSEAEVESEPLGRARRRPSAEARAPPRWQLAHRTLSGAHQTVRCPLPTVGAGHASPADCVADRCAGDR